MAKKAKQETATVKVKPCPFCSEASDAIGLQEFDKKWIVVTCTECGAIGPKGESHDEALELWNSRTIVVLPDSVFKKLQGEKEDGTKKRTVGEGS